MSVGFVPGWCKDTSVGYIYVIVRTYNSNIAQSHWQVELEDDHRLKPLFRLIQHNNPKEVNL